MDAGAACGSAGSGVAGADCDLGLLDSALGTDSQMKQQIVVQILEHAIKVVRLAPRRLDPTDVRGVVEEWQRFDAIGQVNKIYASLRRRR